MNNFKTIYLQENTDGETTWCEDEISKGDTEYIDTEEVKKAFEHVWKLLDGIMVQNDNATIWYDEFTTAHERLVEIVLDDYPDLSMIFQKRLEEGYTISVPF